MARKKHNPGCPCCAVFECSDVTYDTDDFPAFPTAEGEAIVESSTGKWEMQTDDQLIAPTSTLQTSANAWFHEIRIEGDIDLTWDGITVAIRPASATVTTDGVTVPVMPPDGTTVNQVVVLYVTPNWYSVFFKPRHVTNGLGTSPTTRGSIQTFDRTNDTSIRTVAVTAKQDDARVVTWRIADASVKVASGEVVNECIQPVPPLGTEVMYQFQRAGSVTQNGKYRPQTFTPVSPGTATFNLYNVSGPDDWDWVDNQSGDFGVTVGSTGALGDQIDGRPGTTVETYTSVDPAGIPEVRTLVQAFTQILLYYPTGATPFPKPQARHTLALLRLPSQSKVTAEPTFNEDGEAYALLSNTLNVELEWEQS